MRKIKKIILSLSAVITAVTCTQTSLITHARSFYDYRYSTIFYGNEIVKEEDNFIYLSDNSIMYLEDIFSMSVNYMIDKSVENVDNEYLDLSDKYNMKKIQAKDCNIYRIESDNEEELDSLLENSQSLYDNGKIKNVYKNINISFAGTSREVDNSIIIYDSLSAANLRTFLVYTDEAMSGADILGDANYDCDLTVRDCSEISVKLAKNNIIGLPETADYNGDCEVNVRDAAAIAKSLAQITT